MDATYAALQDLQPPVWVRIMLALSVLGMVGFDAAVGRRDYRALLAGLAAEPAAAETVRARFLYRWVRLGWAAATTAVLLVVVLPGLAPADLGLRAPDRLRLTQGDDGASTSGLLVGMVIAIVLGLAVSTLAMRHAARRARRFGRGGAAVPKSVQPMLPTGARDRRAWIVLSITAGVTEEITYRGLALLAVAAAVPIGRVPAIVTVSVLFGLAHAYQGVTGVLATGASGAAFAALYLSTGSLLPSMVVHALVDLRALLLRPTPAGATPVSSHESGQRSEVVIGS